MKSKLYLAIAAAMLTVGVAKADTVTFTVVSPNNVNTPEFQYNRVANAVVTGAAGLHVGPGFSSGVTTTLEIDQGPLSGIKYEDVYLLLNPTASQSGPGTSTQIAASGNASTIGSGSTQTIIQGLQGNDVFQIWTGASGKKDVGATSGAFANKLVLSGSIGTATISFIGGKNNGSFNASDVTYTGGDIYAQFPAANLTNPGDFTFSFSGVNFPNGYGTTSNKLNSFSADSSGTFDASPVSVPLPLAAWGGMGLMGMLTGSKILRRRNESNDLI